MRKEDKLKGHYYGVKSVNFHLLDLDEGSRMVKGYFASFDTLDADNDVIRKGAFSKSINERGVNSTGNRKIAHLRNHDFEHQIGALKELGEDQKGLYFVSQLGRSTKGQDAFLDYQDGILREHSIGFNYIADKMDYIDPSNSTLDKDNGHWEVKEVKLWEGSAVTFGANALTPVIDVAKGLNSYDATIKRILELSEILEKSLKNGQGTDERLENIELQFAQLKQLQNSLMDLKPSIKDTSTNEPNEVKENQLLTFLKQIK